MIDGKELFRLFQRNAEIASSQKVEILHNDCHVYCRAHVYDEIEHFDLQEAARECVLALAKGMPERAYYTILPEIPPGAGAHCWRFNTIVPFRLTISYSLGLWNGEYVMDGDEFARDEDDQKIQVLKSGYDVVTDAFVSEKP